MPTYVYRCNACEHQFETVQKITEEPLKECPRCGGELAKVIFPVGIVFKGSGFHVNDYPSKKPSTPETAKKDAASDSKPEATASKT